MLGVERHVTWSLHKLKPSPPFLRPSLPSSLLQDKGVFATFKGSFNAESITSFLVGLTTGKEVTAPLPGGKLAVVPASAWDGKEAVVEEEEEFSLEDIMGEEVRRGGGREGRREGGREEGWEGIPAWKRYLRFCFSFFWYFNVFIHSLTPHTHTYMHTALMLTRERRRGRRRMRRRPRTGGRSRSEGRREKALKGMPVVESIAVCEYITDWLDMESIAVCG